MGMLLRRHAEEREKKAEAERLEALKRENEEAAAEARALEAQAEAERLEDEPKEEAKAGPDAQRKHGKRK